MQLIMDYLTQILFSLISFLFVFLYKKVKSTMVTIESTRKSLLALTKNLFIQKLYSAKRQKSICIYEKEALINLYKEYKNLGGNGVVSDIFEELDKIPIDDSIE